MHFKLCPKDLQFYYWGENKLGVPHIKTNQGLTKINQAN